MVKEFDMVIKYAKFISNDSNMSESTTLIISDDRAFAMVLQGYNATEKFYSTQWNKNE